MASTSDAVDPPPGLTSDSAKDDRLSADGYLGSGDDLPAEFLRKLASSGACDPLTSGAGEELRHSESAAAVTSPEVSQVAVVPLLP